jgi:hypothetical protein
MGLYVNISATDPGGDVVNLELLLKPLYDRIRILEFRLVNAEKEIDEEGRRLTGIHNKFLGHQHVTGPPDRDTLAGRWTRNATDRETKKRDDGTV